MELIKEEWYGAIKARSSRRAFQERQIKESTFEKLEKFIKELNQNLTGSRAVLFRQGCNEILKGVVGSYGVISGTEAYLVFIGDKKDSNYQLKTGYLGEAAILEATHLGLDSCWVGGFFKQDDLNNQLNLAEQEEILAIAPIGHADSKKSLKEKFIKLINFGSKRKDVNELCVDGFKSSWPGWIRTGIKAARLAPSAMNRQPWRFSAPDNMIVKIMSTEGKGKFGVDKKLDCGIAMLHFEVGAFFSGAKGEWKYLNDTEEIELAEFHLDKIL